MNEGDGGGAAPPPQGLGSSGMSPGPMFSGGPQEPPVFLGGPPAQVGAPPPRAKSSSARPIVLLLSLSALSAAICAGVILWMRHREAAAGDPAAAEAPEGSGSAAAVEPKTVRAVVQLPEGQPRGVMRREPAFDAPVVIMLPPGTAIEVVNFTTVKGQTWCRVRTIDYQPAASGWMHQSIVKMN
jgi:hypothetical protein